jgi:hypothetical protein
MLVTCQRVINGIYQQDSGRETVIKIHREIIIGESESRSIFSKKFIDRGGDYCYQCFLSDTHIQY